MQHDRHEINFLINVPIICRSKVMILKCILNKIQFDYTYRY